ncbi:hypothetical protein BWQ93_00630 [Sphingopyxis sp. QXT-31]|nr:hypothetical protein BWQ93_00630 [Sphingopyxis sp. QXT-31]
MASGTASAQNMADWKRQEWRGISDPATAATETKVEAFLRELRLEALPDKPIEHVYSVIYSRRAGLYQAHYRQPNPREEASFTPDPAVPRDCTMLVEHEAATMFDPSFRQAMGIELQSVEEPGKYMLQMAHLSGSILGTYAQVYESPFTIRKSEGGARYYREELKPGQPLSYYADNEILGTYENIRKYFHAIHYRVPLGACSFSHNQITVKIPLRIGLKSLPKAAPAPAPKENKVAAPTTGGPTVLIRSGGPAAPKPAAPKAIVYTPGVRPTPPKPPAAAPCPKGLGYSCATQLGGPLTPEAIAYHQQMDAYEAAVKAYEADEAAKRQAVADLNKQKQAEYSANLAAIQQERNDALAARQAKIDADKAAYNAALKAHQDESTRLSREHEAAMAEWRRKTAACLAGDMSQCANSGDK